MKFQLQENGIPLVKTHDIPKDNNAAIYVIRDGRAACVSLWRFYNGTIPLEAVIEGRHMFGTWANHVQSWSPWERPNSLLLRYEDLRDDLPKSLETISQFLNKEIISEQIPSRDVIEGIDGRWVKTKTDWKSDLHGKNLQRFIEINGSILKKSGYI